MIRVSCCVAVALLTACGEHKNATTTEERWFDDVAADRGMDLIYASGATGAFLMPEIMGGGAALFDMDDDGDLDAFFVQGGSLVGESAEFNALMENDGAGRFTGVYTEASSNGGYGMGVTTGDFDDDGDADLYVTNLGSNVLLANDGSGTFTDVTDVADVAGDQWSTSAAFVDVDGDGDLDLYVCNYLQWSADLELECVNTMGGVDYCSPRNYMAPASDSLYENLGDGTFRDISAESGIAGGPGTGLGVVTADFTGDGNQDIFVANDGMADSLWVRGDDGVFVDRAVAMGCAFDEDGRASAGMGVVAGDIDDDGDTDVMVCNLRNEFDSLFRNEGGRYFTNVTAARGLAVASRRFTRFGMGWYDFDHDGHVDLYQANGRVMRERTSGADPYAEPNLVMRGGPDGFSVVSNTGDEATSRAAAFGDVDGDGDVDVFVVNRDAPAQLFLNTAPKRGHWIGFDVRTRAGAPALGARVSIRVGDRTITRTVRTASSYLAANDPRIHIGLGEADQVDEVTVTWPDGTVRAARGAASGRIHQLAPES